MIRQIKHPSRDCLIVADAILRLLDSLPDGDLPDDVREAYDDVSNSVFGFVCATKRWEQTDEAFRARAADMFVWSRAGA